MQKINLFFMTIFFLLITGCSGTPTSVAEMHNTSPEVKLLKDGTIKYKGFINFIGYELLKDIYDVSPLKAKPTTILIESTAGIEYAGIMIGRFIHENNIDIIVEKYCSTPCSSYIFPAARKKYLKNKGMLLFVSNLFPYRIAGKKLNSKEMISYLDTAKVQLVPSTQTIKKTALSISTTKYFPEYNKYCKEIDLVKTTTADEAKELMKNVIISCEKYRTKQNNIFYHLINVNPKLQTIGAEYFEEIQSKNIVFFTYDNASLKKLNINNIHYDKEWDPTDNVTYKKTAQISID